MSFGNFNPGSGQNNRTTPGYSNPFEASRFRFKSLGVGLTDPSFRNLALETNQYMLIGEQKHGTETGGETSVFNFLVDSRGLAVNTTLEEWDRKSTEEGHAFFIDGSIFVTGSVFSQDGQLMDGRPNPEASELLTYWKSSVPTDTDRIYHNGSVTIGSKATSGATLYAMTIARPSNYRLSEIQLALQNQAGGTTHMGFVGNGIASPFIVATSSNSPIEFHVGRGFGYFNDLYRPGDSSRDYPVYSNIAPPALTIDSNSSVVVNSDAAPQFRYDKRVIFNGMFRYDPIVERAKLHVSGLLYASNIVMHDPDTNGPVSLDSMFVRKDSASYLANRIFPGAFARGTYTFPDALQIGDRLFTSNLAASNANIRNLTAETATVSGESTLSGKVMVETDVQVRQNIFLQGGIYVESTDSNGSNIWSPIAFTSSNFLNQNSNIISFHDGFYTTGRAGVGVNRGRILEQGITEQLVVARSDRAVMGVQLRDETSAVRTFEGFLGHVDWSNFNDGSLVFMTAPAKTVGEDRYFQNIYFMPGKHKDNTNNYSYAEAPPALAVLESDQVVVNGRAPAASNARLTVGGDTYVDGNIFLRDPAAGFFTLAQWREVNILTGESNLTRPALQYKNPGTDSVGIHTDPNLKYAFNVAGRVFFPDGIYDFSENETSQWYNTTGGPASLLNVPPEAGIRKMFTQSRVGVGVVDPQATMEIKAWDPQVPTQMVINQSAATLRTSLLFRGTESTSPSSPNFVMETVPGAKPALVMRNTSMNVTNSNHGLAMIWDDTLTKHRLFINQSPTAPVPAAFADTPDATMTIGGGLNVIGDINVSGQYRLNGTVMINESIANQTPLVVPGDENVYISGNYIALNPTCNLTVGYNQTLFNEDQTGAAFRVYQPSVTNGLVARFVSKAPAAQLELFSEATQKSFRLGFDLQSNFAISSSVADEPFFYVKTGAAVTSATQLLGQRGVGYGTQNPQAFVHIVDGVVNEPMFRITRTMTANTPGVEPTLDLERRTANDHYIWRLRGPDFQYQDRLTLEYMTAGADGEKTLGRNAFTVTKMGDMGLGTDTPAARMHLVSQDAPVLLLQTSNATSYPHLRFSTNHPTTYNIAAESNGSWYLHSIGSNVSDERRNLLEFSSNGKMGIRELPNDDYTLSMSCNMNILGGGIFIDGVSVLQGSNLGRLFDQKFYHKNLYMLPDPEIGSITVNRPDRTSNWFHIRGRNDDPAVLVLESTTADSWLYQQATGPDTRILTHRIGMSNATTISREYLPGQVGVDVIPDGAQYLRFEDAVYLGSNDNRVFAQNFYSDVFVKTPNSSNSFHLGTQTALVGLGPTLEVTASNGTGFGVAPQAIVHIGDAFANGALPNLRIDQAQAADAMVVNDRTGSNVLTVNDKVGIRIQDPQHDLHVNGTAFIENDTYLASDLYVKGDAHNTSDRRVKDNLVPIEDPLDKLCALTGYLYNRLDLGGKRSTGLIAQDVHKVLPEAVHQTGDGYLSIAYGNLMGLMVESIKELRAEVETLKTKLKE